MGSLYPFVVLLLHCALFASGARLKLAAVTPVLSDEDVDAHDTDLGASTAADDQTGCGADPDGGAPILCQDGSVCDGLQYGEDGAGVCVPHQEVIVESQSVAPMAIIEDQPLPRMQRMVQQMALSRRVFSRSPTRKMGAAPKIARSKTWASIAAGNSGGKPAVARVPQPGTMMTPCSNALTLLTWNVENLGSKSSMDKKNRTTSQIRKLLLRTPDIVFLQEAESCAHVDAAIRNLNYSCVDTPVPGHIESRSPMVLGGVILYKSTHLSASNPNRITYGSWAQKMTYMQDSDGYTLADRHAEECNWTAMYGCSSPHPDVPKAGTVRLKLKTGKWCAAMKTAFPDGFRAVNVHLFSGGRMFKNYSRDVAQSMRDGRRAFQMRAHFWTSSLWNSVDGTTPTTIYAGDFNTKTPQDMQAVVSSGEDYGVNLWYPKSGGEWNVTVQSKATHRAGSLDNIVMDLRPANMGSKLTSTSSIVANFGGAKVSDHSPLWVKVVR